MADHHPAPKKRNSTAFLARTTCRSSRAGSSSPMPARSVSAPDSAPQVPAPVERSGVEPPRSPCAPCAAAHGGPGSGRPAQTSAGWRSAGGGRLRPSAGREAETLAVLDGIERLCRILKHRLQATTRQLSLARYHDPQAKWDDASRPSEKPATSADSSWRSGRGFPANTCASSRPGGKIPRSAR